MFTKKNLGINNCASCEKGLVGLQGMPVEHTAWKKLPFREPGERIARYAAGFSKMLSTIQPDSTSNLNINQSQHQVGYLDRLSPFSSNPNLPNQTMGNLSQWDLAHRELNNKSTDVINHNYQALQQKQR